MSLDPRELARKKFTEAAEAAIKEKKSVSDKADAIIWAAVTVNAGLGAVPFGINNWTFIGVNTAMVVWLGTTYGHHLTDKGASAIIKQIFSAVGMTTMCLYYGAKFFAEVLKGVGLFTMGGPTLIGMALDAVLCGAMTYALGYTAKEYFERNQSLSQQQMNEVFMKRFEQGKTAVRAMKEQQQQQPPASTVKPAA
jgi:uncharacterized protein (DUF697 family)